MPAHNELSAVTAVLLQDGEWHAVVPGSLHVDEYQFVQNGVKRFSAEYSAGTAAWAFSATTTDGAALYGPLTALLAVKTTASKPPKER